MKNNHRNNAEETGKQNKNPMEGYRGREKNRNRIKADGSVILVEDHKATGAEKKMIGQNLLLGQVSC